MKEYGKSGLEKEAEDLDFGFVADLLAGRPLDEKQKEAKKAFDRQHDAAAKMKDDKRG